MKQLRQLHNVGSVHEVTVSDLFFVSETNGNLPTAPGRNLEKKESFKEGIVTTREFWVCFTNKNRLLMVASQKDIIV